ncbi:hypothetical protein R3P38DRAFT_3186860 [Favolaschia claudopus]|uniref:F-box domain-containing protein n=1 Tax=Favolaschia claudopus TaxID=2862362 RepID=A0AAW0C2L6_9AGAR
MSTLTTSSSVHLDVMWASFSSSERLALRAWMQDALRNEVENAFKTLAADISAVVSQVLRDHIASRLGKIPLNLISLKRQCLIDLRTSSLLFAESSPSATRVPLEVWWLVFDLLLQDAAPGSVRFCRTRGCLALVCPFLNAAVLSYPPFWKTLRIDLWSTKHSVDHFIARNAERPMTVIVVDGDPSVRYDADDDSMSFNPGTRSIDFISAFNASLRTVRLWASLIILSPYPSTVEYIFNLLRDLSALALSRVRVACLPWIPGRHCIVVGSPLNPSALTHLRFEGFGVYKFPIASSVSLQVLRLVDLPVEAWPSFVDLMSFFENATRLEELEFRNVGACRSRTRTELAKRPPIILSSLRKARFYLDNRFPDATELNLDILRCLRFPFLHDLHLYFHGDADLRAYKVAAISLSAPCMSLSGYLREYDLIRHLYSTFRRVVSLDLSALGGSPCFAALGLPLNSSPGTTSIAMPRLVSLCVEARDWIDLYVGLLDRSSVGSPVRHLEILQVLPDDVPIQVGKVYWPKVPTKSLYAFDGLSAVVDHVKWTVRHRFNLYSDLRRVPLPCCYTINSTIDRTSTLFTLKPADGLTASVRIAIFPIGALSCPLLNFIVYPALIS